METTNNTNKSNKNSEVSLLKKLFDIKRPTKVQSNTFPRTTDKSEKGQSGKERLFVRNESYRKKSSKNKYKKQSSQANSTYSNEHDTTVKKLCQQFESIQTKAVDSVPNFETSNNIFSDDQIISNVGIKMRQFESIQTKAKDSVQNLETSNNIVSDDQIISNVGIKRRPYDKNSKQQREYKIQSFVEAESEDVTEEYRKSLISEMDMEIAQMKEDGFIDDDGYNISNDIDVRLNSLEHISFPPSETNIDNAVINKNVEETPDSDTNANGFRLDTNVVNQNEVLRQSHESTEWHQDVLRLNSFEEFNESLGDDLENGLFVVEAYNDDGRELIEVEVMIDRRPVSLGTQGLKEVMKESHMVFLEHKDRTYDCIHNELTEYLDQKKSEDCPSTSFEENIYENVETVGDNVVFAPLSNRSTMYSVTSQDSSVFDTDDEGIGLGRNKEVYSSVRRETFCDEKGVVRIERVAFSDNLPFPSTVSRSDSTASLKRLEFIIDEIKSTEKKYVDDLAKVVKIYKPWIEKHTSLELKDYKGYLFGNIDKIYRRQRKFLEDINKCGRDVNEVVQCFVKHELLFELYPHYFRNKPKADNLLKEFNPIIKEMQEKFEERLDFSAYLLTPVQRLGKYILLLEQLEKQLKKLDLPVDTTQTALAIVREEMSKGNDSVAIESIENSPISKMDYGSFKMREMFNITKPRKLEAMVFLFSNVVVFATCDPGRLETFYYYDNIKMNDLRIATFNDCIIHLTDYTKSKKKQNTSKYTYVLEAKTEKIWKTWKEMIEKMLWDQLRKTKESLMFDRVPRTIKYVA